MTDKHNETCSCSHPDQHEHSGINDCCESSDRNEHRASRTDDGSCCSDCCSTNDCHEASGACCEKCAAALEGKPDKDEQKRDLIRVIIGGILFAIAFALPFDSWFEGQAAVYASFVAFLIPYLVVGYEVLADAAKNIVKGAVFDENFLMSVATLGAFALVLFPDADHHFAEGAAVMLFFQVGELFEGYAVGKTRSSIAAMMDIAPEFANVREGDRIVTKKPGEVAIGSLVVVRPGERVPLDGIVVSGESALNTAALTGESAPRTVGEGDGALSGCINESGTITIETTKPYADSTVARILDLVENASEKKARTESFITRFARYYTPVVTICALLLAVVPPLLFGQSWSDWIQRGLVFLVVSCPCALVISVPLSFFGGIGAASRKGILIKGSNYLEALANASTIAFDKTGTLTNGTFSVTEVYPAEGFDRETVVEAAALAEAFSTHPIATAVRTEYAREVSPSRISDVREISGHGVCATVDGRSVLVGNKRHLESQSVAVEEAQDNRGTIMYVGIDGAYAGCICIADKEKEDSAAAIAGLKNAGVEKTVMLTGDREAVANHVSQHLGIDEFHAELLPQQKVEYAEQLLEQAHSQKNGKGKFAFVGDGINDAPVLMRSDIGIAMGAMGSDAAIEAADVVLMDDKPSNIATAVRISKKTMGIVWQNIVFALGIKFLVLGLAAAGVATMWLAVFADVGVAALAILNAMRALRTR